MKKNLLFAAMIAVGLMSNAQDANFDDAYPNGWIVNREIKLAKYDNPITERLDTGMVTPAISGNTQTSFFHMVTTSEAVYGTNSTDLRISFDAFPFKKDTRDFSGKADNDFKCSTTVKAYLVPSTYTATTIPTNATDIIAVSDVVLVKYGNNVLSMDIDDDVVAGQSYRVLVAASNNDCNDGKAQAYVIDNVVVAEALFNENFDEGIFTGLDWNVLPGLTYESYNNPLRGCANDRGIATPAITGNLTTWLVQTNANVLASASSEAIKVRFDFLAFAANANLRCASAQDKISCSTSVNVFVLDANNTSTGDRPSGKIYGESGFTLLVNGNNEITIPVTAEMEVGKAYRLLIVGKTENCPSGNAQRYVVDNVGVWSAIIDENFADAFPEGWDFNRELKITQYSIANACQELKVGLTTAPINGTFTNLQLITSPITQYESLTRTINASFNLYAYDADTRDYVCDDQENSFKCNVTLRAYLVPGNYNSTPVPTANQIYGQSAPYQMTLTNRNIIAINITRTLNESDSYRIVVFGSSTGCNNDDPQVYVIDDIRIEEIAGAPLPVTFTHFTAKRNKSRVELTWETAMEENNRGFHVQRNIDGTWKNIGFVFSQANNGNSSEALSYSFNDVNSSRGITQYRLLQVDHDNKGKYSEVRSVRAEEQLAKIMVYPNPSSTGSVNVMFEDASALRDVHVTDVAGRVIKQYRNVNTNLLTIENLADGYYTIQITNRATAATTVEKVIIKKR